MTVETLRPSLPTIACTTIARAERLVLAGLGWSADQVLRRALDLLEERYLEPDPQPVGRTFTREELVAILAGDNLEPARQRDEHALAVDPDARSLTPSEERYLLALAEALDPDPNGERV